MDSSQCLPTDIAQIVFKSEPQPQKTYQMFCESDEGTSIAPLDLFEIFLTILLEGVFIRYHPITADTIKNFNEELLSDLRPWLHSLGFNVNIDTFPKNKVERYENYYCKVILRSDPSWVPYFDMHPNDITKDYHFIFGGNSPYINSSTCDLKNLYAVFVINQTVHKISFNCI